MTPVSRFSVGGIFGVCLLASVAASGLTTYVYLENRPQLAPVVTSDVPPPFAVPDPAEESQIVSTVDRSAKAVASVVVTKEEGRGGTIRREVGGGTAFLISPDGLLLTNKHVVDDPEADYTVLLNDGTRHPAEVVAQDPANDIALLQIAGSGYPFLPLAEEFPKLGQTVIAIGNSLGEFRNTVSVGVVSGLMRSITAGSPFGGRAEQLESIIQTDAAINQGNSGGPLLNSRGEVLGMNTAIAAGAQNIGFAIPASDLRRAVESYRQYGEIRKTYLGVRYMPVTPAMSEANDLPYDYGALVVRGEQPTDLAVVPGSPADQAGLRENDIILEVDGIRLDGEQSLAGIIQRKQPGDTVMLLVYSEGEEKQVEVELQAQ